jgi:hypothetical protein
MVCICEAPEERENARLYISYRPVLFRVDIVS